MYRWRYGDIRDASIVLIKKVKKTIDYLEKVVINYPHTEMILKNEISMGHARVLSKLENVDEANEFMISCNEAWDVYIEKCERWNIKLIEKYIPVEYRIMNREVSEWKVITNE